MVEAECTTLSETCWTRSPAYWSESPGSTSALWIADKEFLILIWLACEGMSHSTVKHLLIACESKIRHTLWALRLTHAAREGVEAFLALGVPHEAPLFTVLAFSV